jgi:hypothetical protein
VGEDIDMERKPRFSGFAVWIFISVMIVISSGALGNQTASRSKQPIMYKMQIVPAISSSYDINSLAIQEDLATFYLRKWFYRAPAIGLWIVLALAILLSTA